MRIKGLFVEEMRRMISELEIQRFKAADVLRLLLS